jgi:methylmalonyl-CoA/ethylmalonyl-CoA epimerase
MSLNDVQHLFTAIDHVGIAVPDLDEAIAFYTETYGMTVAHEETNEEQGVREAMVRVGDTDSCIQLLAPLSPDSTIGKFLDRSGPGLQQLAYRVADIDAVSATLRERGLRLLYDAPKRGTSDSRVNFIHPKDAGRSGDRHETQTNLTGSPGRSWASRSVSASTTTATTG